MVKNSAGGVQKIQKEGSSKAKAMPSSLSSSSSSTAAANKKKYKGVRMRSWGSWVSEIRAPNQKTRIWLGSYSTAEAAARAYDAALLCLKGSSANLNFPSTASTFHNIPQDTLLSPKSIQRLAAAAANCFLDNAPTPSSPPPDIVNPSSYSSPSPSSSFISSPSMSASSPSDQLLDDDVYLMGSFGSHDGSTAGYYDHGPHQYDQLGNIELPMAMMESSWNNFDSLEYQWPKYVDQMLSGDLFGPPLPPVLDDFYEESDIPLWSFC